LRSALDRLATGHGTTLVVLGEAGVGKSRLVREAAADAGARRVPVLIGRAVGRDRPRWLVFFACR
jgi:MoxR-like ATPase